MVKETMGICERHGSYDLMSIVARDGDDWQVLREFYRSSAVLMARSIC